MTTITTAKLREMAHTLGTTPGELKTVVWSVFGVTIDDTPIDDTEKDTPEAMRDELEAGSVSV